MDSRQYARANFPALECPRCGVQCPPERVNPDESVDYFCPGPGAGGADSEGWHHPFTFAITRDGELRED